MCIIYFGWKWNRAYLQRDRVYLQNTVEILYFFCGKIVMRRKKEYDMMEDREKKYIVGDEKG